MNTVRLVLIGLFLSLALLATESRAQGLFGAYEGVLTNHQLKRDQLVKLQLIHSRSAPGTLHLRAILTLQFGGYDSGEYVSYHYENVTWNLLNGELTFHQTNQEVQLEKVRVLDGRLRGELRATTGLIGNLELSSRELLRPQNSMIEPLGGEYAGSCGKVRSSIQLMTYRSSDDTTRLGNPFGVYEVKGQIGKVNLEDCSTTKSEYCTYSKISGATYDFFNGTLVLQGYPFSFSCEVSANRLSCGECQFQRVSKEMKNPKLSKERFNSDPIAVVGDQLKEQSGASFKGEYFGFVFHENLKLYQKIRIEVSTFKKTDSQNSTLMLAATANLYFGNSKSEILAYRFDPIEFPNPLAAPQFILSNAEEGVDAVLGIQKMSGGVIRGSWNSLIFGRVGSFVVTKNGDLPSLTTEQLFGSVSSGYREVDGLGFIADMIVGRGTSETGSQNPFDPLKFTGYVWRDAGNIRKDGIQGGSYDFYSGKIAILFGEDKTLNGFVVPGRDAELRRLGGGFRTLMQSFELSKYKKENLQTEKREWR